MKKYKLIKEYPGSPKLGIILEYNDKVHQAYTLDKCKYYNGIIITNYPEFWEEVIEKDYEILSFKQNSDIEDLWTNFGLEPNCWCRNIGGVAVTQRYTLKDILNNSLYSIYSVKRLSDGEIFTVGDRVYDGVLSNVKITKIEIINDRVEFLWEYPENNAKGSKLNFKRLKCIKKPLFTTEDGVDIFDGDLCWWVRKHPMYMSTNAVQCKGISNDYLYFSIKEKAKEYILMNKPCLSINDVMSLLEFAYNLNFSSNIRRIKHNLTEFVKSKL